MSVVWLQSVNHGIKEDFNFKDIIKHDLNR